MNFSGGKIRRGAAAFWLFAPLAAHPLVFAGNAAGRNFSDVRCATCAVLGVSALAICCAFPERIAGAVRRGSGTLRAAVAAALALGAIECVRFFSGGIPEKFFLALFYAASPLAGIALAGETRKLLPGTSIALGALAVLYGALSPRGEGLMLNWNWNATLIALALPFAAGACFPERPRRAFVFALLLLAADLVLSLALRFNFFSLGTWCAASGAGIALFAAAKGSPRMRRIAVLTGFAVMTGCFLALLFFGAPARSYRVQLWRGTEQMILSGGVFGVGAGNFEDRVAECLPPEIYVAPFPANRHLHPHNETLFFLSVFGPAGGAFFLLLALCAVAGKERFSRRETYFLWGFFLLFFHGCVDVLLGEPLTATLFYAFAGALIDAPEAETPRLARAGGICGAALFFTAVALALRETAATVHYRRAHEAFFSDAGRCRAELAKSLFWKTDAPALYLAGCDAVRALRFDDAERIFDALHRKMRLGGYLHSNHFAGRAALMRNRFPEAIRGFAREDRRFPFSVVNAFWMARFAEAANNPENLRLAAEREIDSRLALRGKTRGDLDEFLLHPERDDQLVFVSVPERAPEQTSKR